MCRAQQSNTLVMDVEGTDGRERGEDQDFERKSALFSLATAEVLLVNMWEHQVGLYQGGETLSRRLYSLYVTDSSRSSQHGFAPDCSRGQSRSLSSRKVKGTKRSQGQGTAAFRHQGPRRRHTARKSGCNAQAGPQQDLGQPDKSRSIV